MEVVEPVLEGGALEGEVVVEHCLAEVGALGAVEVGEFGVAVPGPRKMAEAWQLGAVSTRRLGDDILVVGDVLRSS